MMVFVEINFDDSLSNLFTQMYSHCTKSKPNISSCAHSNRKLHRKCNAISLNPKPKRKASSSSSSNSGPDSSESQSQSSSSSSNNDPDNNNGQSSSSSSSWSWSSGSSGLYNYRMLFPLFTRMNHLH